MTPEQYRQQWSTLTGRPANQVYVPEGIRGFDLRVGSRVHTIDRGSRIDGRVLEIDRMGTAKVRWDDGLVSFEGIDENGRAM